MKIITNSIIFIMMFLFLTCSSEKSDALRASKVINEVIISTNTGKIQTVVPYGMTKLITIFNPKILNEKQIGFSYILESELYDEIVMVVIYKYGNQTLRPSNYYYSKSGKVIPKETIPIYAKKGEGVSGRTKIISYFCTVDELRSGKYPKQAISNVITFYVEYSNGIPISIEL